jgi:transglutaminase-like putative cysteine protease
MMHGMNKAEYLQPGAFIESDAPSVVDFARKAATGAADERDEAIRLYHAVRDGIVYDPYVDFADPSFYRASSVLARGRTFCVGKAALLAAAARVVGIPARIGFADVKNHLTSRRLRETLKTDTFIWHSYSELYLDGRWVKATPAFDLALCEKVGLKPLEFDGATDSLFHEFDRAGKRHMEYLRDRGPYPDVPFDTIIADFRTNYPFLFEPGALCGGGEFRNEAVAGDTSPATI